MATRNLEKLASIEAQLRLLVPGKVQEDDKLIEIYMGKILRKRCDYSNSCSILVVDVRRWRMVVVCDGGGVWWGCRERD
ncbi:putative phosphoenolpyruvate carboxylase [Helianthus anomalus]